jgi:plasmid maintenance system antidote protein VapI
MSHGSAGRLAICGEYFSAKRFADDGRIARVAGTHTSCKTTHMHNSMPMLVAVEMTKHRINVTQLCQAAGICRQAIYDMFYGWQRCTDRVATVIGRVLDLSPESVKEAFDDMQRAQKGAPK